MQLNVMSARAIQLIEVDGRVSEAAEAVFRLLVLGQRRAPQKNGSLEHHCLTPRRARLQPMDPIDASLLLLPLAPPTAAIGNAGWLAGGSYLVARRLGKTRLIDNVRVILATDKV